MYYIATFYSHFGAIRFKKESAIVHHAALAFGFPFRENFLFPI